ncbi:hypothetical protein [Oceanicaulis sp.]|uniref:hypothetical protein n=1 Tax=Oceanicaulis sp. TaxID=1924941 RepID=UPI003BAAD13C
MLRLLSRQLRDLNWVVVAVEFAIVVAGVLLAFQISAWSEAHRARSAEAAYLTRLADEVDAALAALDADLVRAEARLSDFDQAMALLSGGDALSLQDEAVIRRGLTSADRYPDVSPPRVVLDDLASIGGVAGLDDAEIRQALSAYQQALDRIDQRFERYARDAVSLTDVVGEAGPVRRLYRPDEFSRSVLSIDFQSLQNDAAFQTAFLGQLRVQIVAQDDRRHVLARARALDSVLDARLEDSRNVPAAESE